MATVGMALTSNLPLTTGIAKGGTLDVALGIARKRTAIVEKMRAGLEKRDLKEVLSCAEQLCGLMDKGLAESMLKACPDYQGC